MCSVSNKVDMLQSHTLGADLSAPPPENPHARPLLVAKALQDADR